MSYYCVACQVNHGGRPAAVINGNPTCGYVVDRLNSRGLLRAEGDPPADWDEFKRAMESLTAAIAEWKSGRPL